MNKSLGCVAVIGLLVLGSGLALDASAATALKVSVPFDFSIGETVYPAGDYQFEVRALGLAAPTGSAVTIRNLDGDMLQLVLTRRSDGSGTPGGSLIFNRYGNAYFLVAVRGSLVSAVVNKSEREKELAIAKTGHSSGAASETRVLIAAETR